MIRLLGQNTKRESGRKVQLENINAGKVRHFIFFLVYSIRHRWR